MNGPDTACIWYHNPDSCLCTVRTRNTKGKKTAFVQVLNGIIMGARGSNKDSKAAGSCSCWSDGSDGLMLLFGGGSSAGRVGRLSSFID
ncbi:hypothetical protein PILCRDRAFT_140806 [Piloderma croceum F 1598]|uniref:Uncharacterized protein n=1 Tax=Piloderma croceum (strain F 1598) TaxID=765440 RepID=A0A0C3CLX2_PILCF|nr:hypothetical protein PILCRDRAFT_140806 [Piloderma croceum F 1598]